MAAEEAVTEFDNKRKGFRIDSSPSSPSQPSPYSPASSASPASNEKKNIILQRNKVELKTIIENRENKLKEVFQRISSNKNILKNTAFQNQILETFKNDIMNLTELSLPSYKILAKLYNLVNIKNNKSENYIIAPDKYIKEQLKNIFNIKNIHYSIDKNSTNKNNTNFINMFKTTCRNISDFNKRIYDSYKTELFGFGITFTNKSAMRDTIDNIINLSSNGEQYKNDYIKIVDDILNIVKDDYNHIKSKFNIYKEICETILNQDVVPDSNSQNPFGDFNVRFQRFIKSPDEIVNKDSNLYIPRPKTAASRPTTAIIKKTAAKKVL